MATGRKSGIMRQPQHSLGVAAGRCQYAKQVVISFAPYLIGCGTGGKHGETGSIRDGGNSTRELAGIGCKYVIHRTCGNEFCIDLFGQFRIAVVVKDDKLDGSSHDAATRIHFVAPKFISALMHGRWLLVLAGEPQGNSNTDRLRCEPPAR